MLADPQTITIDGTAISLALVSQQGTTSLYRSADGLHRLKVAYTETNKNTRYLVRYEEDAVAADPISTVNQKVTGVVQLVLDQPAFGIDDARFVKIVTGLKTLLATTGGGFVERVLSNEH